VTFFFEIAGPCQGWPSYFSGPMAGRTFYRVCWLWFSVGVAPVDLPTWEALVRNKTVRWHKAV
jgi:hypothetical protein